MRHRPYQMLWKIRVMCREMKLDKIVMAGESRHAVWLAVGHGISQVHEMEAFCDGSVYYHRFRFRFKGKNYIAYVG